MLRISSRLAAVFCLTAIAGGAFAQTSWPSKPVRVIVPFTAGSATDILARAIGERLAIALGQPFVVENVPGAGGTIGIGQVARANPDGHTVTVVSTGHVVNPVLYPKLTYELKDLAGISPLGTLPSVLVTSPQSGARTLKELVDLFKSRPGQFNYATAGVGSAADVHIAKLRAATGLDAVHIPLRGTPAILTEIMAGRAQLGAVPLTSSVGPIRDGKVVPLAVSTPRRSPALADVPTAAEAGFPSGEFNFWIGMLAPAATPRPIVERLNGEIARAMGTAEMKERLDKLGTEAFVMSAERFDAFIAEEAKQLGAAMRAIGAKGD